MVPLCKTDTIALTPYSALASGRLSRLPDDDSNDERRFLRQIKISKHRNTRFGNNQRVNEISAKYEVLMTEVSLAWLLEKVTSPVVGATKMHHVEGAVNAVDLKLYLEDMEYLEEPYTAHDLVGVMADNKVSASDDDKVRQKYTK